jgi:hypothetical protein
VQYLESVLYMSDLLLRIDRDVVASDHGDSVSECAGLELSMISPAISSGADIRLLSNVSDQELSVDRQSHCFIVETMVGKDEECLHPIRELPGNSAEERGFKNIAGQRFMSDKGMTSCHNSAST